MEWDSEFKVTILYTSLRTLTAMKKNLDRVCTVYNRNALPVYVRLS